MKLVRSNQHGGPVPPPPDAPQPSLAEHARTLAAIGRIGSLSTHSRKLPNYPFGSMMPYAVDDLGRPIFFISGMAMHTHNLQRDNRASLLIVQPEISGDPLGAGRVTLLGRVDLVPADSVRDLYLARHENARYWQDFTDFAYYRLEVDGVYCVGGFGVMGWITPQDYAAAAPDPLAAAAPEILRDINTNHPDALRRLAASDEADVRASLISLDRLGFQLRIESPTREYARRIAFPREMKDPDEACAVLLEMLRAAS